MSPTGIPPRRPVPVVGWASDRDPLAAQVLCRRRRRALPAVWEVYPSPVPAAAAHLVICAHCGQEPGADTAVGQLPEGGGRR